MCVIYNSASVLPFTNGAPVTGKLQTTTWKYFLYVYVFIMSIRCNTRYIANRSYINQSTRENQKLKLKKKPNFLFLQLKKEREFIFQKSNFIKCFKKLKL